MRRMNRRKRRTDWLYANAISIQVASPPGGTNESTTLLLPTEYIDQDVEGHCTLLRIVGDFTVSATQGGAEVVQDGRFYSTTCSILKTQVDDSGVANQLDVDEYGVPALGASAAVGGARSFLWTRRFFFPIIAGGAQNYAPIFGNGVSFPRGWEQPGFDLRVKRRLVTGECLVFHMETFNVGLAAAWDSTVNFAYRILVAR